MKKLVYLLLLTSTSLYAQNVVYKCVDVNGSTSYLNSSPGKGSNCQKTDLADPNKSTGMVIRNEDYGQSKNIASRTTSSGGSGNIPIIRDEEQKKKDEGRANILSKELQDEQEQLNSVQKMLANVVNGNDSEQISKLKDMQGRHLKNIASLKKELGIKNTEPSVASSSVVNNVSEISQPAKLSNVVSNIVKRPMKETKEDKSNLILPVSEDTQLNKDKPLSIKAQVENFLQINK